MKITTDRLLSFVKNNPQHFNELHPLIKIYFDKYPVRSCGFCPNAIKPKDEKNINFINLLLCNKEARQLILDKSKSLLDDDVEIEDFSVINCGESSKTE